MDAIKRTVGDQLAVRLDPNTLWQTPSLAVKIARRLEGYNVECLEDPIPNKILAKRCKVFQPTKVKICASAYEGISS